MISEKLEDVQNAIQEERMSSDSDSNQASSLSVIPECLNSEAVEAPAVPLKITKRSLKDVKSGVFSKVKDTFTEYKPGSR